MPSDGSASTMLPTSAASSSPSSPVPAPMSMACIDGDNGTCARMMSAIAAARSWRSGVSQSRAFWSNDAHGVHHDGRRARDVVRGTGSRYRPAHARCSPMPSSDSGFRYFVTGSVAASVHGRLLRQSHDTDVVLVDAEAVRRSSRRRCAAACLIAVDPIAYGAFSMASIVERDTADKVDVIVAPSGAFEASAMQRRQRAEVPGLGPVWVATVDDLALAKLVWSEGTSELQLRDCAQLLRLNAATLDRAYLEQWGGAPRRQWPPGGGRVMRPDPGLELQEAVIAGMSPQARGEVRLRLAARGKLLAWQQVDAMAPASELKRAELLLRRLYPTLPRALSAADAGPAHGS